MYMAAMTKEQVFDGKMDIPRFTLPEFDQINETEKIWKVYSASYYFSANGLEVPGQTNILIGNTNANETLTFFSKPSILSLSLNNGSVSFTRGEVAITFDHHNTSLVILVFILYNSSNTSF